MVKNNQMTNNDNTLKPVAGYYWYNTAERLIAISGLLGIEAKRSSWVLITEEERGDT